MNATVVHEWNVAFGRLHPVDAQNTAPGVRRPSHSDAIGRSAISIVDLKAWPVGGDAWLNVQLMTSAVNAEDGF
jgi:hypothetical protein